MKYDPNAPLIRAKSNYAKDKYNEDTKTETMRFTRWLKDDLKNFREELLRLRSEKEGLITDEKLVSFVGEVPTPKQEEKNKNGSEKNE